MMMKRAIRLMIRLYRKAFSPMLKWIATGNPQGALCRYEPTCSRYCEEAVGTHGVIKGLILTLRRLLRCHPWGGHGYDPVPPAAPVARSADSPSSAAHSATSSDSPANSR